MSTEATDGLPEDVEIVNEDGSRDGELHTRYDGAKWELRRALIETPFEVRRSKEMPHGPTEAVLRRVE